MENNRLMRRHPLVQFIFDNWLYLAIAILMWRLPYILGDYFDQDIRPRRIQGNQPSYWMGVFIQLYIVAILAMSYNLVFGFAGLLSFGHALFFGIGVYVVVILMSEYAFSVAVSSGVALGVAVIFGAIAGMAAFRIKGVYFAMFTLALAQFFHDLARVNLFKFLTQGDDGRTISDLPDWINPIQSRLAFYNIAAVLAGLTFITLRRLMNSPTGRVIAAVRENEERAQTMGYNTVLYKTLVLVIGGFFGTLSGILHALFSRQAEPSVLSITRTVDPLLMTIIGGVGTHPGPVVGAIIMQLGEVFFRKPDLQIDLNFILFRIQREVNTTEIWRMILGAVFILIVLAIPFGVVGQVNLLWIRIRQWVRRFIYDPLVRANPKVAVYMQPITGEPPEVAHYFAAQSKGSSMIVWAKAEPLAAAYAISFGVALLYGLINWNQRDFISMLLLLSLVLIPLTIGLWLRVQVAKLREQGWLAWLKNRFS